MICLACGNSKAQVVYAVCGDYQDVCVVLLVVKWNRVEGAGNDAQCIVVRML